jgi:hypothetical protein
MKKNSQLFLCLMLSTLLLSSCFNINEDITINKKGAGTYSIGIDMSPALSAISMVLPLEGLTLDQVLSKMDLLDFSIMDALKRTTGVHEVRFSAPKKFNYALTMKFDNIAALNAIGLAGENGISSPDQFVLKGNTLSRKALNFDVNTTKISKAKKYMSMTIVKDLLGSTKFITTYHFAGRVVRIQNRQAVLGIDGKSVLLEATMKDLLSKSTFNDVSIKFKKK